MRFNRITCRWSLISLFLLSISNPASTLAESITVTGTTNYNLITDYRSSAESQTYTYLQGQPAEIVNVVFPAISAEMFNSSGNPLPPNSIGIGTYVNYPNPFSLGSVPKNTNLLNKFNDALVQWGFQPTLDKFSFAPMDSSELIQRYSWSSTDTNVYQQAQVTNGFSSSYSDDNYNYYVAVYSIFVSNSSISFGSAVEASLLAQTPYQFEDIVDWINFGGNSTIDYVLANRSAFGSNSSESFARFVWGSANVTANITPVPEPSTMLLLGCGLAGLAFWRKRKSAKLN